jgi:hypothetical protein
MVQLFYPLQHHIDKCPIKCAAILTITNYNFKDWIFMLMEIEQGIDRRQRETFWNLLRCTLYIYMYKEGLVLWCIIPLLNAQIQLSVISHKAHLWTSEICAVALFREGRSRQSLLLGSFIVCRLFWAWSNGFLVRHQSNIYICTKLNDRLHAFQLSTNTSTKTTQNCIKST